MTLRSSEFHAGTYLFPACSVLSVLVPKSSASSFLGGNSEDRITMPLFKRVTVPWGFNPPPEHPSVLPKPQRMYSKWAHVQNVLSPVISQMPTKHLIRTQLHWAEHWTRTPSLQHPSSFLQTLRACLSFWVLEPRLSRCWRVRGLRMRTPLTAAPPSGECDLLEHRRHLWLPVGRTFTPALLLVSAVLALRTFYCPLVFIINEKGPE